MSETDSSGAAGDGASGGDGGSDSGGSSWFEGVEHTVEGALDATGHFIESAGHEAAGALEAAGATAEDAAKMVSSDADMIPGIAEVAGAAEATWHGINAVYDAATGNWDGAAGHALSMTEAAANAITDGGFGLAEGAIDFTNAALGGGESTDAHHLMQTGMKVMGEGLGDAAYSLVHGGDSADGSSGADDPGAAEQDQNAYPMME